MNPLVLMSGIAITAGCSIAAIVMLGVKSRAERIFRTELRGEMQLIRTDANSAIEATRNEFAGLINSFKGALDQAIDNMVASTKQSQDNADNLFIQFKTQVDTALEGLNQFVTSHLEGIRSTEAKSLEEIRTVIDTKLKIVIEKMMEEGYKVQREHLALSTQKAHFLQFSETLEVVSRTISSAAESLSVASKKGRDITEKLIKNDSSLQGARPGSEPNVAELAAEREKRKIA
ncbi:MAG: hypothetical protein HYR96_00805 [Deltaproteobacteria bacterium]|nr:hypothetical protein [Deltaproteobacteria bacterium]MBI3296092.1 hypothetical protein [Deltaproteobacteria bacterium]